jgi:hypothetical protein
MQAKAAAAAALRKSGPAKTARPPPALVPGGSCGTSSPRQARRDRRETVKRESERVDGRLEGKGADDAVNGDDDALCIVAYLQRHLGVSQSSAEKRSKDFAKFVMREIRASSPDYDMHSPANVAIRGGKEVRLYRTAQTSAFETALQKYIERASPVADGELASKGRHRK